MRLLCLPQVLFFLSTISLAVAAKDNSVERGILLELYQATGGPSWNNNHGWDGAHGETDVCDWYGVICVGEADFDDYLRHRRLDYFVVNNSDESYRVMGLDLHENFLNGRVPSSLWSLPLLQYVDFNKNEDLQVDFSQVQNAKQLSIVKFQNTATSSLAGLEHASPTLDVIHASGCPLRSGIPKEVLTLTSLRDLQLAKTQLQGTLDGLEALTNLRDLNLFDNELKGSFPNALIQLTRLQKISVSRNRLTGDLHVVDAWSDLQEIYLAENQFQGPLPSMSSMPRLNTLYFNDNSLDGPIPNTFLLGTVDWEPNLSDDPPMITVDLSRNQLTGQIPASLADLKELSIRFDIHDNKFDDISQDLCQDAPLWNRGAVSDYGCDGLACPPGTYSVIGIASSVHACHACESAQYYGATTCVQEDDKSALMALYKATDGDNWYNNSGWKYASQNLDWDYDDVCSWYGVHCWDDDYQTDENGRVRVIYLDGNNLKGTVPTELFTMEYLHTLNVARNPDLVVPLTLMGESKNIRYLDISQTATVNFDGIELVHEHFAYLVADGLNLGGTLPSQILNVTSLRLLSMAECELIGEVPEALGNMAQLNELFLYDNNLRGTIPSSLGQLNSLRMISLAKNQLTGTLPNSLDDLQNLEAFSIADQTSKGGGISGPLKTFRFHPFLKSLQLNENVFTGTLPVQLMEGAESLHTVLKVNLGNNRLTGQVPGGLARFLHMDLELRGNRFSSVDPRLCENKDWNSGSVAEFGCDAILCPAGTSGGRQMFFDAPCEKCPELPEDENSAGVSPNWMGQDHCSMEFSIEDSDEEALMQLLFRKTKGEQWSSNQNWLLPKKTADGSPVHVCDWFGISCDESRSIVSITLGSNNLRGTLPTEIYMLPNLELISLFGNPHLAVPMEGIENAHNLRALMLDSTALTSLDGIGKARSLTELNVKDNNLKGSIPEDFSRLINLKSLTISGNSFEGTIPYWLSNLPSLETFMAADNKLSGSLPEFSAFRTMTYLDLSNNKFSGEIPLTFLKSVPAEDKVVVDLSGNDLGGTVPRELQRLERLTIHLQNNRIKDIDRELCTAAGWNDMDVQNYGCDGILCPAGTSSASGRQMSDTTGCTECEKAKYMGSTACYSSSAFGRSGALAVGAIVTVMSTLLTVLA